MIVGTAGHIDHGKTALVKALTGVDADRLEEEKRRGITIELGFAYADLGAGRPTGFVDVPGHERLIHTMLAGAGGIDFVLLVVAAADGPMPQTREHLAILDLLGLDRGAVALTKADLADPARRAAVEAQIRDLLAPTGLAGAPVLPVSVVTGEGVGALRALLAAAEVATAARGLAGRLRLPVDRAFTLAGAGAVVTGTLLSGTVAPGDAVTLSPSGLAARVRSVHAQNRPVERGLAGQRCALNLAGEGVGKDAISRGDVVVDPALHAPTDRVDAVLRLLPEARPLAAPTPAHLHVGAVEVGVRVVPLGGPIEPGASGPVQLVLERPVAVAVHDRFILRDVSARRTLGGGRLLDLRPPARHRRAPERLALLAAAAEPDPARALAALLALAPVEIAAFVRDRALAPAEAEAALAACDPVALAGLAVGRAEHGALRAQTAEALAAFHEENPELQGLGRERLRLALRPRLSRGPFLAFLHAEAEAGRIALDGAFVRLPGHEARLSAEDAALWEAIAPGLGGAVRFRPPRVRDIAGATGVDEREIRRVLKLCGRMGRVDQIAHDHFFLRATTAEMVAIAADVGAGAERGWFTAAQFRDRMDNGRKVAIQILDFLDRNGVTIRRGDLRRVNPPRLDLFGGPPAGDGGGGGR
ncbi:selenocysteine-specific translation elongation factor [Amaricoccus sp.]|uniref:selenocysteine-specific translation elongation factor n=1 Tax=Amaricoccus sp. TaxID=1872485 RepID=UPI001B7C308A|nr:selenocysteine-specific translation elongation factor [Amaricoccus sp.]MBP7001764.1 selenocysteine-specific translation elongation factor [Amaricoccus sp.]